ncbi:PEP-CTERM putative exosortase interaction domain-containing protein [Cylindrospermum stagnale PCC 7417]|uniref:PEP-CTERM putative exosortase interaction domain-containing protein n=1 Tax=Cylindrospermum stagnale PCC 7417 TaxID=56107 RepID=K9WSS9_9NOST|nr:PEP-CTERM sorting domain-containing protein [Cylindrospermum stagnale]AFZ22841.1 PEP-CTERM putative exosortase interaction domain-containing protein [Cylindrospermum stagnale PCC 7417]
MKRSLITLHMLLIPALVGSFNQQAHGVVLNTVNWNADNTVNGTGTGILDGVTVSYTTAITSNAGTTINNNNWNTSFATDSVGASILSGGALGINTSTSSTQTQTINFSGNIVNPVLLFNYLDGSTSFSFSGLTVALLDSFNASLSGSTVSPVGANNGFNDGFALKIFGNFGSANPLVFQTNALANAGPQTVAFTVGTEVPEPASMIGLLMGLSPFGVGFFHKRKQAQKSA